MIGDFSSLFRFPFPTLPPPPSDAELAQSSALAQQMQAQQANSQLQYELAKAMMGQQQLGDGMQNVFIPPQSAPLPSPSVRARELFVKRMGGVRSEFNVARDDFLWTHVQADTVYVFFCFAGKEGVTKEQIDIFPSDQLIAQFRMILA
jgi:hypothetical protein